MTSLKLIKQLSIAVLLVAIFSCKGKEGNTEAIELPAITFTKEGELTLYKANGAEIRTLEVEIADNDYERETGLMHRKSIFTNRGMLFIVPEEDYRAFYMKNTQIPLDIIYLNKDGNMVSFAENATPLDPTPLSSQVPAQYVLEINAGLAEEWSLEIGDYIEFKRS